MSEESEQTASGESEKDERFVILLRHGIAEERTGDKPDEDRTLTPEGNARMKQIARGLAAAFPKAEAIFSSPLVRAIQTGLWVTKGYHKKLKLQTTEALRHDADPAAIIAFVRTLPERRVILIGHEPHLSRTAAGWTLLPVQGLELRKGGCYGLRMFDDGPAKLEWLLPPRILRRIE